MDTCPHCNRKLVTRNSPRCSWCGEEIHDAQYLAEAKANREAMAAEERAHDEERNKAFSDFEKAKRASRRLHHLPGSLEVDVVGVTIAAELMSTRLDRSRRTKADIDTQIAIAEALKEQAPEDDKAES